MPYKKCKRCGKKMNKGRLFCSKSCAGLWQFWNSGIPEKERIKTCAHCGGRFTSSSKNRRFCSRRCTNHVPDAELRRAFREHRGNARGRGVSFLLTYEEWFKIWQDSGKLSLRGSYKGQYVMARRGDVGPYAVGNVFITTCGENISYSRLGKKQSEKHIAKLSKTRRERGYLASLSPVERTRLATYAAQRRWHKEQPNAVS